MKMSLLLGTIGMYVEIDSNKLTVARSSSVVRETYKQKLAFFDVLVTHALYTIARKIPTFWLRLIRKKY
jgi:hypothetical protein